MLHDAIEDQKVKAETIAKEFGQYVADIVLEVTDDKSLPKAERNGYWSSMLRIKVAKRSSFKLADKISNIRAIANSPAPDWTAQRKLEYLQWARDVVAGLRGTSPSLESQFDEVAARAEGSLQ